MSRDPRFLRLYEQELRFVRDLGGEFAAEHARVANRFGLDGDSCADPHVEWLLDGFAFLAARVQHRLEGDHAAFTHALLGLLNPDHVSPTPSACIAALDLAPDAPPLADGFTLPRGTRLTSRPIPGAGTRCTYLTAHPVTLWPLDVARAAYLGPTALAAIPLRLPPGTKAGLSLTLKARGGQPLRGLKLDRLALHLAGGDRLAHALYEALAGRCLGLAGRPGKGDPLLAPRGAATRLGFAEGEALLPPSPQGFSGHRLLREYFLLPERFLFLELSGLAPLVAAADGDTLEITALLSAAEPALEGAVTERQFALGATPALNLFPHRAKPITVEAGDREHHVVGDRLRTLDYEVHSITAVTGYGARDGAPLPFHPLYALDGQEPGARPCFALERRPRLVSEREEREGVPRSAYLGSEVFLQLSAPGPIQLRGIGRLDVETLCTNRDLPLRLPLPAGEAHFTVDTGGPVAGARILGTPTPPGPAPALAEAPDTGPWGTLAWRLVGHLGHGHATLAQGPDGDGGAALRDLLTLLSGTAAPQVRRQVGAVRDLVARPVVRRLSGDAITFGRGLELDLELMETGFAQGGAFLLGGVLEAFFRRSVTLNSFTETVVRSSERGEIMRWPARIGTRQMM